MRHSKRPDQYPSLNEFNHLSEDSDEYSVEYETDEHEPLNDRAGDYKGPERRKKAN